jgi:hypothetical protein
VEAPEFVVAWPTLFITIDWVSAHCVVPDGFRRGAPFEMYPWQEWCTLNHYRVREDAEWIPEQPLLSTAFHNRRSLVIAPQKALALDTAIATPAGWTTMGEVQVGDQVFDESGDPCTVLSKSPVWDVPTYRVTFSDGASLVACGDHEWWVERRTTSGTYVPDRVRTENLVGNLLDAGGARRFRVRNARPLNLPEAELPVDPYVLGTWLGDGHSDDGRLTGLDREVFDRVAAAGYEVRQMKVAKRVNVIGLKAQLRQLGVLGNKHVPAAYLRASEEQRWALLQGLMDTDGYADARAGKCEFVTTLPALRDGVSELLASLGVKPLILAGNATLNGRVTGRKWRVTFAARSDMPVFHLDRKQSRLKPPGRAHAQFEHRRIVSVEPEPAVPTQCLTVSSPSHVFLAGREMIPTCNTGKGPWSATGVAIEAVGPALFAGWAGKGDGWACSDHGCGCGWEYEYAPGEPMAMRWPTPLIQITATSSDQADNIYRPLKSMIKQGPLSDQMKVGEEFTRILGTMDDDDPELNRIDVVTSSAQSRLGNPITYAAQDETGIWTKQNKMTNVGDTQNRGLAGMQGRSQETTNAPDPTQRSQAQMTWQSDAPGLFKFWRPPPSHLSYANKAERRKIHAAVYAGSRHISLEAIEGFAFELIEKGELAQAERFYGNRMKAGAGTWLDDMEPWKARAKPRVVQDGTAVVLGFDGSDIGDSTAIRAETEDGYQFTPTYGLLGLPTIWSPADWDGQVPRLEVRDAMAELMRRFHVVRMYGDPPYWVTEMDTWAAEYGEKVVIRWYTQRPTQMQAAAERLKTDISKSDSTFTHDGCEITERHVEATHKEFRAGGTKENPRYVLTKPDDGRKIDACVTSILCHEAAGDVTAAGLWTSATPVDTTVFVFR